MKIPLRTLLLFTGWMFYSLMPAQGIEFFHGSWEEGLAKAKDQDKIIFVDAFAKWCGPCKRMAATTFTNDEVGEFFNSNFICMKIDMEEEMGLRFRDQYPVSAFPTLFFIDEDGEVVQKSVGAKDPQGILALAQSVLDKYDKSSKYVDAYEAGDRSYDLVYNYVAALNKAGKPSVKISNDYLSSQEDLTTPDNLKFILEAATQVDCQCFELMEQYKKDIAKIVPEEVIDARIRTACTNTVKRAIEFESHDLVNQAADAMKRHLPGEADEFKAASEVHYALALHELSDIDNLVTTYAKRYLKNNSESLYDLALEIEKYAHDDKACMNMAVELAGKAAKDEEVKYVSGYASLVQKTMGKDEAIKILDGALKKYSDPDDKDYKQLMALRKKIEDS
jgi:thiol-disulfide isomerase/thioredoxin